MTGTRASLVLAPVLYLWPEARLRDFYYRIADEAPVDCVHVGEVVCGKRRPLLEPLWPDVIERLEVAGKEVVRSTLALIADAEELEQLRADIAGFSGLVEANDYAAVRLMRGRPHVVGPYVNVYNEDTLALLEAAGAVRVCPPPELPLAALGTLAGAGKVAIELQLFGRQPLALSARCYHARSRGRRKDSCRFACGEDPDGMPVDTLDGVPFVTVNGIQTLSRGLVELSGLVEAARAAGVHHFRLGPENGDMVRVAALYRELLDGRREPAALRAELRGLFPAHAFVDGYAHGRPGMAWIGGQSPSAGPAASSLASTAGNA